MPIRMSKQVIYVDMDEEGRISRDNIPRDGKYHPLVITDTANDTQDRFKIYCRQRGNPVIYTQTGLKIRWPVADFSNHTSRKFQKTLPKREQKTIHRATIDFLRNICPDFASLQDMIDVDMKIVPTMVDEKLVTQTVSKRTGKKRARNGKMRKSVTKVANLWNILAEHKFRLCKGETQSKKSWAMTSIALYYLLHYRISTFIIVQNSRDAGSQLEERIRRVFSEYVDYIDEENLRDRFDELFAVLDVSRGKTVSENDVRKSMDGRRPRIFICLRNSTDIIPVNTVINNMITKRYALIIDESDETDSGVKSKTQTALNTLKDNASIVWDVTATPLTNIFKDPIDKGHVFVLTPPRHYKSLPMINFKQLPYNATFCNNIADNPFVMDPNLKKYIQDLAKTHPYNCTYYGGDKHPVYSLIRLGNTIAPHKKAAAYTYKKYGDRIVAITYNGSGDGITMRGKNLPTTPISIPGTRLVSTIKNGVHHIGGTHIGKIITWLYNNGGVQKFPRIAVFAGAKANRGISFGADNYSDCMAQRKICWHLTEMYFIAAKGMTIANLLQAIRLTGVFADSIPLTCYSNVCKDICDAYHSQEEWIERSRKMRLRTNRNKMCEVMADTPMAKDKIVKGRKYTAAGVKCRLKKVKDDGIHGGWDWQIEGRKYIKMIASFGTGTRSVEEKRVLTPEELETVREEVERKRVEGKDVEVKTRIDCIIRAYNTPGTLIKKLVDIFVTEDFRSLSLSELKNMVSPTLVIGNYNQWNLSHRKYHVVNRTSTGRYILRADVMNALGLVE